MSKAFALWKTIRPLNLLIMAFTMWGVYIAAINLTGHSDQKPIHFVLMTLSILLLGAGGNIINDFEDIEVDSYNKPGKNLIDKVIPKSIALRLYRLITLTGLIIGITLSYIYNDLFLGSIIIFIAAALWLYTVFFQRSVLIGNLTVAGLCGILPLLVIVQINYESATSLRPYDLDFLDSLGMTISKTLAEVIAMAYALFAFLITLIREIIKDIEDMEGDSKADFRTLPIKHGINIAKTISIGLTVLTLSLLFSLFFSFLLNQERPQGFLLLILLISTPLLLTLVKMTRMKSSYDASSVSSWLKLSMGLGIASTIFFWFL